MNNDFLTNDEKCKELYKALLSIKDEQTLIAFLDDLCTYKEIEQMSERVVAARLLMEGNTYEDVISKTKISSATLSRVSKCVKYGNGYNSVIKKESK